jgi:hypothetical protein
VSMRRAPMHLTLHRRCLTLVAILYTRCKALPLLGLDADCKDEVEGEQCKSWAQAGECERNPGFMHVSCRRSCSCPIGNTACLGTQPPAKGVGGIDAVFARAQTMTHLMPTLHSSAPYVLTFDKFVTDDECEAFISTTASHFERSLAGDVVSPVRTSKQAWCQPGIATECYNHPLTQRVAERVANVTGVPVVNAEFFQVLRYEPGQFYKVHHDQNARPASLMGVRLFTFFIYLHSPEGGGGTHFPRLNVTSECQQGRTRRRAPSLRTSPYLA